MDAIAALADWSLWAFAALFVIAQVIFFEGGLRLGARQRSRASTQAESVGLVAGALLGLLAFVLALTLSFATSRFSERRAGALAEANAIGTAWLRAEAIAHPRGRDIAKLLERYAQVRLDFVHANRDPAKLDALSRETNQLQSRIWGNMAVIAREEPNAVSTSLMSAINETFDTSTAERFGYVQRLPPQVFRLITGMTLLGVGVLGFQLGLKGTALRPMVVLLMCVWALIVTDILDLAAPRLGRFRISGAPYEWTIQGFKGGLQLPEAAKP
jgi:hypothetical protein